MSTIPTVIHRTARRKSTTKFPTVMAASPAVYESSAGHRHNTYSFVCDQAVLGSFLLGKHHML
jgi:hypothetical protein